MYSHNNFNQFPSAWLFLSNISWIFFEVLPSYKKIAEGLVDLIGLVIDASLPLFYTSKDIQIIQWQINMTQDRLANLRSNVVFCLCFDWHDVSNYAIMISIL